jgi:hypothetical protein
MYNDRFGLKAEAISLKKQSLQDAGGMVYKGF